MIHDDGTMDVRLADGTIERRRYTVALERGLGGLGRSKGPGRYEPELRDGEEALWFVADLTPTIVQVRAPQLTPHERGLTDFDGEWSQS